MQDILENSSLKNIFLEYMPFKTVKWTRRNLMDMAVLYDSIIMWIGLHVFLHACVHDFGGPRHSGGGEGGGLCGLRTNICFFFGNWRKKPTLEL
jgi:hypothetical protein